MKYFGIVEAILRNRFGFFAEIRDSEKLPEKIQAMLVSCLVFLGLYGAAMGATHSLLQSFSSLVKLPVLFFATLTICTPSLYIFNLLFGSKQTLMQNITLILTAMTVTAVLLFGFAPIILFFLLTSSQYEFFKLLNVVFFTISGFTGVFFLGMGMQSVTSAYIKADGSSEGKHIRRIIFALWIVLYGFVGSQMAWTLSPFIGAPREPFIVFAQPGGNFYADVLQSVARLLGR
jgi:hypothetical protein